MQSKTTTRDTKAKCFSDSTRMPLLMIFFISLSRPTHSSNNNNKNIYDNIIISAAAAAAVLSWVNITERETRVPCNSFYYKSRRDGNNTKSKCERENLQTSRREWRQNLYVSERRSCWDLKVSLTFMRFPHVLFLLLKSCFLHRKKKTHSVEGKKRDLLCTLYNFFLFLLSENSFISPSSFSFCVL